jgi:GT2 family glycosyltransferase
MLFSVVIPTYNRLEFLPRALESVWAQTNRDFEVIVIDDGSTDGTLEWLAPQSEHVRILQQHNRGPGAARNLGWREAQGDYIAFFDSDDIWLPWSLDTFAALINKYDGPAVLGAKLLEFEVETELQSIRFEVARAEPFPDYFTASHTGYSVGAGMAVVRRDALLASGGFIEERVNAEDHDLIFRLGTQKGFVQILAPVTLAYRRHPQSETSALDRTLAGILRMIEQEHRGEYPGGAERARQRWEILTRHARAASFSSLRGGFVRDACRLYAATFSWQFRNSRWTYLAALPCLALSSCLFARGAK